MQGYVPYVGFQLSDNLSANISGEMMNLARSWTCMFRLLPKMMNMGRMLYCTPSLPNNIMTADKDKSGNMMQTMVAIKKNRQKVNCDLECGPVSNSLGRPLPKMLSKMVVADKFDYSSSSCSLLAVRPLAVLATVAAKNLLNTVNVGGDHTHIAANGSSHNVPTNSGPTNNGRHFMCLQLMI